jgi:hypothetical protein
MWDAVTGTRFQQQNHRIINAGQHRSPALILSSLS